MSFSNIRTTARVRFNENQIYLNLISSSESIDPSSFDVKIMRGLFYVHLYASLEKIVNEIVQYTLLRIAATSIKNSHYSIPFNTISLYTNLQSFKNCSHKKFFGKSIEIFNEMRSTNVNKIIETMFSQSLQNVWVEDIVEIITSFGIKGFVISLTEKVAIDELVGKRNAVAHGRETASDVGERFRTADLRSRMNIIIEFCNRLIDTFEIFYTDKQFLKASAKKYYTVSTA